MFSQFDHLLSQSQYVSHDYWQDCGLLEAEEYLRRFESHDWQTLAENLPIRPDFWRLDLITVLQQTPSEQSIYLLGQLLHDANQPVALEAKRAILKLVCEHTADSAYALPLQQLAAGLQPKKSLSGFSDSYRKQPNKPVV